MLPLLIVSLLSATQDFRAILDRAMTDFRAGRIEQSLEGFDRVAKISPADAPYLWQRGIAQYYAGKFRECRDMFASHRTVNPDDVENARHVEYNCRSARFRHPIVVTRFPDQSQLPW